MNCRILQVRIIGKCYLLKLFGLEFLEIFDLSLQLMIFILQIIDIFSILLQYILLIEDLAVVAVLLLGVSGLVLFANFLGLLLLGLISDFKIMAPSKLFRLKNTDDPLLFVPLGNNYFYLVHKWGNDLHPYRKLLMWPLKSLWNMIGFLLVVSLGLTYITPTSIFSKVDSWSVFWMIYFFMFKAIASIVIFYAFALGKNFNKAIWNSKYNKSI